MVKAIISPSKYVQGAGALKEAGKFIAPLGKNVFILTSNSAWRHAGETLKNALSDSKITVEHFGGECSKKEIERLKKIAADAGAEVVVGFGGGKTLDTAKAVAYYMGLPVAVLPSIAATDAPCSALTVIYTPEGAFEEYLVLPNNPNLVLVDTEVVANAPARFLVSGMGDALATKFEADACKAANKVTLAGGISTITASAMADLCYRTIVENGYAAKLAAEKHVVTPALEKVVEANTLLSGLGFESGGLAAAHAIHDGFTVLPETHAYYHGEKVAFSTLVQLTMEGQPMEVIYKVMDFCKQVGLPTTLKEIGIEHPTKEALMKVAEAACAPNETIHNEPFPVTPEKVYNAILAQDALGSK